ncbi:hypothetical protein B0H11DRAFT_354794 [Mycena galericulata]|nr:hypothetical protein B0H11DRAFT_354794 [Mycena galericulata]
MKSLMCRGLSVFAFVSLGIAWPPNNYCCGCCYLSDKHLLHIRNIAFSASLTPAISPAVLWRISGLAAHKSRPV